MTYEIIKDEQKLKEFINWLPELGPNEKFYVSLFARKKYDSTGTVKSDKSQLKRFVTTKDRLFDKIRQLEIKKGFYKFGDKEVSEESLVLYINPNPRDLKKATLKVLKKISDLLIHDNNYNIHAESLSAIQVSPGKKSFIDFDIDDKTIDLELLKNILPENGYNIIETRGGYHILVRLESVKGDGKFYNEIRKLYGKKIDQVGDQMIPVPGCTQGGFIPKIIK